MYKEQGKFVNISPIQRVTTFSRPYYRDVDRNQGYYKEAIKCYLKTTGGSYFEYSMSRFPHILRTISKARRSYRIHRIIKKGGWVDRVIDVLASRIEGPIVTPSSCFHGSVGQYLFQTSNGSEHKICIDVHDSGDISCPELLQWSDIYFKTNFWRHKDYSPKVLPMINGNPIVLKNLSMLRSLRTMEKKYDICFIVRIWAGIYDEDQIEHNIRILEAISRVDGRKFLYAYVSGRKSAKIAQRLDKMGIPWSMEPMPLDKLWYISAQALLSVIRLGVFYCVPWRMTDMLAMGACPVLDCTPYTVWPQPMIENTNFLSLGLDIGPDKGIAQDKDYASIPARIEAWLSENKLIERICAKNCEYYDDFIDPQKIGDYIIETVQRKAESKRENIMVAGGYKKS